MEMNKKTFQVSHLWTWKNNITTKLYQ